MIRKILISQPRPATERNPYTEMEAQFGVQFDFRQLIHVEGLSAREFRQQHINPLDYTAVIPASVLSIISVSAKKCVSTYRTQCTTIASPKQWETTCKSLSNTASAKSFSARTIDSRTCCPPCIVGRMRNT